MAHLYRNIFIIATIAFTGLTQAQDSLDLEPVEVSGKKFGLKKVGLYEGEYEEDYNIRGFNQLTIFEESLGDFWTSENATCISGKLVDSEEKKILHVEWNKDQNGCDWVGMGFGWSGWSGKDLSYVLDTLAIELIVRSTGDDFTNIPWAFCLEDYSGGQAWLGYNTSFLKDETISKEWTKVLVPLSLFPFEDDDVDASNIKQLLIQTFAEGEIEIESIKLVPFAGKLKQEATAAKQTIKVDGDLNDWTNKFTSFQDQEFAISYTSDHLYFAFKVSDDSPRQNSQKNGELWNGDAIEIAFSTNPNAAPKRKFLLLSDQHIGINCGDEPYVWNWKTNTALEGASVVFNTTNSGYLVEMSIPTNAFRNFDPKEGQMLDFEIAIDQGNEIQRIQQTRWNSSNQEGFHQSPALWGKLVLE